MFLKQFKSKKDVMRQDAVLNKAIYKCDTHMITELYYTIYRFIT